MYISYTTVAAAAAQEDEEEEPPIMTMHELSFLGAQYKHNNNNNHSKSKSTNKNTNKNSDSSCNNTDNMLLSDHLVIVKIYDVWVYILHTYGRACAFKYCQDNYLSYAVSVCFVVYVDSIKCVSVLIRIFFHLYMCICGIM